MASLSNSLFLFTFFFLSLIFLSSQTTPKIQKISSDILAKACTSGDKFWDPNLCLKIFKSRPKIMSSTDRVSFVLNIIEAGIENATNTQTYIKGRLNDTKISQDFKLAVNECDTCFHNMVLCFKSAYGEIKDDKDYMTASYDFAVIADQVYRCGLFLSDYKIKEPVISIGMKDVLYFSHPADNIAVDLEITSPPPPL